MSGPVSDFSSTGEKPLSFRSPAAREFELWRRCPWKDAERLCRCERGVDEPDREPASVDVRCGIHASVAFILRASDSDIPPTGMGAYTTTVSEVECECEVVSKWLNAIADD